MMIYLVIILLGLLVFHLKTMYSQSGQLINQIPGPTPIPLFGNALMFNLTAEKMWSKILEVLDQYYPISRVWFFDSAAVLIRHPDDLKALLSCKKNLKKAKIGYDNFRFIGNDGLIISEGEKWRSRRKMLDPAFHPKLLKVYTKIADEHSMKLMTKMKSQGKETIINLIPTFTTLNLIVIMESSMGVDLNSISMTSEETCRKAFLDICEVSFYRATRPYIQDWMMRFLSIGRRQEKAVKTIRDLINHIIEERRNYHKQNEFKMLRNLNNDLDDVDSDILMTGKSKLRLAVLDLLLAAQLDGLIDEQGIREEIEIVLAAGYDTTSTAVALTVMLLAENQKAQELARAEVLEVLKNNHGIMNNSEIQKLDFLDRCVKESLRLFPPSPVIARYISDDLHLKNYTVPANNEAFINFFAVHRDPNFWPEPNQFNPDRFLPENCKDRHPFSYLPFSAGPRVCNGKKMAVMVLKTMVAHVLANFRVEAVESTADLKFEMHITLKPTKPVHAKFIKIE